MYIMRVLVTLVVVVAALVVVAAAGGGVEDRTKREKSAEEEMGGSYCLSWRVAVEANNVRGWRTAPPQCWWHIHNYMLGGQYRRDLDVAVSEVYAYLETVPRIPTATDAWILDVDDTCLSNLAYYRARRFGCEPYDPVGFREWALEGQCEAVRPVLELFNALVGLGFRVILLTGRDEAVLGQATAANLAEQGFVGYERLIMRSVEHRGESAIKYKSFVRRQLEEEEGYRIWGNVGDQWSDLQGDCVGNRTFKLPNPMYFVP